MRAEVRKNCKSGGMLADMEKLSSPARNNTKCVPYEAWKTQRGNLHLYILKSLFLYLGVLFHKNVLHYWCLWVVNINSNSFQDPRALLVPGYKS